MKILVTGCHGLLGRKLIESVPQGYELYGADLHGESNHLPHDHYLALDISDSRQTLESVRRIGPDWVINAAAYTDVDGAEREQELCWRINVTGVENLANAVRQCGARLVHISTDYIFDGKDGPYDENDPPNPLGFYARSKLAGEKILQETLDRDMIIRTMVLYGYAPGVRSNFVLWLIQKLKKQEPVRIVTDQFGNTTLADELSAGIFQLIRTDYSGILHLAGSEIIDRFSFAAKIADIFQLNRKLISPVATADFKQAAPRPLRSGLKVDRALRIGIELSTVEGGLNKFKKQYVNCNMN